MDWERELEERKKLYMPSSYLNSSSTEGSISMPSIATASNVTTEQPPVADSGVSNAIMQGASTGAATGNPYAAAAMVGGSLLTQSMANKAQAEQARRQREVQIAQEHAQGQQRALQMLMEAYRGALR